MQAQQYVNLEKSTEIMLSEQTRSFTFRKLQLRFESSASRRFPVFKRYFQQLPRSLYTGRADRLIHFIYPNFAFVSSRMDLHTYSCADFAGVLLTELAPQSSGWENRDPCRKPLHRIVLRQLEYEQMSDNLLQKHSIAIKCCVFLGSLNRLPNIFCAQTGFLLIYN